MKHAKPIIIRHGHATVTIYAQRNRDSVTYILAWYIGRKRVRRGFGDLKLAKREAERITKALADGGGALAEVSVRDLEYYKACEQKLGGVPLDRAVQFYVQHFHPTRSSKSVSDIAKEYINRCENDPNLSPRQTETIRHHLNGFAKIFTGPISTVTASEIDDYLDNPNWSARTRQNHRASINVLFNYAKRKKHLPQDRFTEAEMSEQIRAKKTKKEIWTVEEMTKLLNAADYKTLPFIAIGAFSGVRASEIGRLAWENFDWENKVIRLEENITKTDNSRLAVVPDNLADWLLPYRGLTGNVLESVGLPNPPYKHLSAVCSRAGIDWRDNASRHSFATYYLAHTQDPAKTSLVTGHAIRMLLATYKVISIHGRTITPEIAKTWFEIYRPAQAGQKIVQMRP